MSKHESFRIGTVGYDAKTDTIGFYHNPTDDSEDYFYWFEFSRINSHEEYNDWFDHLSRKRWFTPHVRHNLIDVLEKLGQSGI